MNRQCRWAERRSWSVQKPIDLETSGCIQTVKELYREHSWHHQFHVHLFLSGRFLILYSVSFHMHSQGCTFVWKTLTWISSICTFYLLGQKTFRHGESKGTSIRVNSISVQPVWKECIQSHLNWPKSNGLVNLTDWSKMGLTAIIVRWMPLLMILHDQKIFRI